MTKLNDKTTKELCSPEAWAKADERERLQATLTSIDSILTHTMLQIGLTERQEDTLSFVENAWHECVQNFEKGLGSQKELNKIMANISRILWRDGILLKSSHVCPALEQMLRRKR